MGKGIKDYFLITVGFILVAIAVEYFYIPNNLAAGGVSGMAILVNHYFPAIEVGVFVLIMNFILFIVAFIFIGGNFGAKTIYASFGLSFTLWLIERFFSPSAITNDLMLAAIFGTLISAIGLAMVFNTNASTGGTDILAKILNKFFHLDMGKSLLVVDFVVTLAAAVTFGVNVGLYALLSVMINGFAIDRIIDGFNSVKEVMIISNEWEAISDFIIKDLERGCTIFEGKGGYTKRDTKLIYAVVGRSEFIKLRSFIKDKDPRAFITISEAHEVLGEGFKPLY